MERIDGTSVFGLMDPTTRRSNRSRFLSPFLTPFPSFFPRPYALCLSFFFLRKIKGGREAGKKKKREVTCRLRKLGEVKSSIIHLGVELFGILISK